ncbi:MAG: gamma-D-glutamyl-meso-diaminopimelate peptidase [Clostridiales bacterium]|nr:gamma-D-glutamyl-meso-diaminopimelate peptidase [Clostridiales bacterium]
MEKLDSKGARVEYIQLALQRAGYDPGPIDGVLGPAADGALRRFQQAQGLDPDGVAGPATWGRLAGYLRGYLRRTAGADDTVASLAQQHNTAAAAIQTANPSLTGEPLPAGTAVTIPLGFPLVPTGVRYSSQLIQYIVEGMTARYPFIARGSIGGSVMGRPIPYLQMGRGSVQVFYNAAIHANEWITTPLLLRFLEEYAAAYAAGGSIGGTPAAALYDKATLFMVPMANPDGVDLVNGVLDSGGFYDQAKTMAADYPDIPFPSGWKANISGVDLNLQFPAGWEQAKQIKFAQGYTRPGPRDYVGPAPLSAPESQALQRFTVHRNFSLILAYHTQGQVIYWKYLDYEPSGSRSIAEYFGRVSGYAVEQTPYASGFAGYKDWFIQAYNRPGYTVEAGRGVCPLPLSQFDQIYRDNLGILVGGITEI